MSPTAALTEYEATVALPSPITPVAVEALPLASTP